MHSRLIVEIEIDMESQMFESFVLILSMIADTQT